MVVCGQGPHDGVFIQAAQAGSTYVQRVRAPQQQRVSVDHLADPYETSQRLDRTQVRSNCEIYCALVEGNAAGMHFTLYRNVADGCFCFVQDDSVQLGQALPMVAPVGF